MKRVSLIGLLLLTTAIAMAAKEYKVSTAAEFIKAIGSDRVITVSGELNLSDVLEYAYCCIAVKLATIQEGETPKAHAYRDEVFDGYQLVLNQCVNLVIQGTDGAAIVVSPRYAYPLSFRNCRNITLRNLTIGHTDEGYCQGGVLEFQSCEDVQIDRCELFGCGIEGITATNTSRLNCTKSIIRDCSYSIMTLSQGFNSKFTDCDFYRCREFSLVNIANSSNTAFVRCRFTQNRGTLFASNGQNNVSLRNCEIHHTGQLGNIDICKFPSTTYVQDDVELNDRGIGPTVRLQLSASKEGEVTADEDECGGEEEVDENEGALTPEELWGQEIIDDWQDVGIELPAGKPSNIKELVTVFCKAWPSGEDSPQRAFLNFLNGKGAYRRYNFQQPDEPVDATSSIYAYTDKSGREVAFEISEGWLTVFLPDTGVDLAAALWKRNNGHKLFIVCLTYTSYQNDQQLILCYDFNPDTNTLSPDLRTSERIAPGYDGLLRLPQRGTSLTIINKEASDTGNYEQYWNGQDFNKRVPMRHD